MIHQQIIVERIGMIEIGDVAVIKWQVFEVTVIRVLLDKNYFIGTDGFQNTVGHRCLAGSCPPTNANYHTHKDTLNLSVLDFRHETSDHSPQQLGKYNPNPIASLHHFFVVDRLIADPRSHVGDAGYAENFHAHLPRHYSLWNRTHANCVSATVSEQVNLG